MGTTSAQARAWAGDVKQIFDKNGVIVGASKLNAGGSIGAHGEAGLTILGTGGKVTADAKAGVEFSRVNEEKDTYNLLYSQARQMQKEAAALATDSKGNFNAQTYQAVYGAMLHDASDKIQNVGANTGKLEFGASSMFGEAYKGIVGGKKGVQEIKSFVKESSFITASPETQATMLRGLKSRLNAPKGSGIDNLIENKEKEATKQKRIPKKPNPFGND